MHQEFLRRLVIALLRSLLDRPGPRYRRLDDVGLRNAAGIAALHTLVDTFTHHEDGPLLLIPLDWTYRFISQVSHWRPEYHGRLAGAVELLMDAAIAGYFVFGWIRRRRASARGWAEGS